MLSVIVGIITKISSQKVTQSGLQNQKASHQMGKVFSESYWNFKFLKLIGRYDCIAQKFSTVIQNIADSSTTNIVWQSIPRFVLETIGFSILIGVIIYVLFMYNNANFVLPIVSMYALAFYRFMPSINKILTGYNQILFHKYALDPLYEYLKHDFEKLDNQPIMFKKSLEFNNVSFCYSTGKNILNNISFNISRGDRVAFVGSSGAGKSTLADILMGLYIPSIGQVCIDHTPLTFKNVQSWRNKIGYIPQSIFLFDGSIAENILCGRDYDENKIIKVLQRAQIYDFLLTKDGLETRMGEGGVMLSGGQKQRVAIARALYSNPEILVLDEATSSLDNAMEAKIMEEVYSISEQVTLIIIAHRLTTIEKCNKIFRIENGQICQLSSWADVVGVRQEEVGV
jgi:ATP-binding cassette subfamily B protein/ATP-binding cassette subfamily C protein